MRHKIKPVQYFRHRKKLQGGNHRQTLVEIWIDKNIPGEIKNNSKKVGETLAHNALATEL